MPKAHLILFRWILGLLLTLSLVIGAAVVLLPLWFNPNDYRDDIEVQVLNATGREIALQGDLSLTVFPWLGVKTQELVIKQPEQIGGDFIRVETAQLRLRLMPLLQRQVELDTIVIDSPIVNVVIVNDTLNSFTVTQSSSTPSSDVGEQSASPNDAVNSRANKVSFSGLQVRDGTLRYEDRSTQSVYTVERFNFSLGNITGTQSTPTHISGVLVAGNESSIPFDLSANALFDATMQTIAIDDVKASIAVDDINVGVVMQQISIADFSRFEVLGTIATIDAVGIANPFDVRIPSFGLDATAQTLQANLVEIIADGTKVRLKNLAGSTVIDNPKFTASLSVERHQLIDTLTALGISFDPAGATALTNVGLDAEIAMDSDSLKVKNGALFLDDTNVQLNGGVQNWANPEFTFDVKIDRLVLDDYLPESQGGASSSSDQPIAEALIIPLGVFDGFKANGKLAVGELTSSGVVLQDVVVDVKSTAQGVSVQPRAKLYDGTLGGEVAFSQVDGKPQLKIQNEIDLVSLGKLFTAADITDRLQGLGSLVLDLTVTERDGVQSNEGTIKLIAKNGALRGVDVKNILDTGYAQYQALRGKSSFKQASDEKSADADASSDVSSIEPQQGESLASDVTEFAELLGTFTLKDFKITNQDFLLNAPLFKITGAGDIDLKQERLDYRVGVTIAHSNSGPNSGQASEALNKLQGITVPIRFKGNLLAPSFSIDTQTLYRSLVKRELDEKKGDYLQEKLGIEGTENMSTKETVKQILLDRLTKPKNNDSKNGSDESAHERPMQTQNSSAPIEPSQNENTNSSAPSVERPMQPRTSTYERPMQPRETSQVSPTDQAEQIDGDTLSDESDEKKPEQSKQELKRSLAEQLLDELFK